MKKNPELGASVFSDIFSMVKTAVVTGVNTMEGKANEAAAAATKQAIENLQKKAKAVVSPAEPVYEQPVAPAQPYVAESPVMAFVKQNGAYIGAGVGGLVLLTILLRRK